MFSFLWGNKVKTRYTKNGSHARHWYAVFDAEGVQNKLYDRFTHALETGERQSISKQVYFVEDPLIRAVIYKDELLTAFPRWQGDKYQKCETLEIIEWSHTSGLEAILYVRHNSGCAIHFFAADYAQNKSIYTSEKNISVNLIGFVYSMHLFTETEVKLDFSAVENMENYTGPRTLKMGAGFCSYMPGEELDEVEFVGHIKELREHTLGDIAGYLFSINITPDLSVDMFIARANLSFDLSVGLQVSGLAWMQGTLEG